MINNMFLICAVNIKLYLTTEGTKMGKNEIDLMILGVLHRGPAHGYQIKKRIADIFGQQYPYLSDSAVYPRLIQFNKEGVVRSRIEVQYNAPNKRVYELTDAGLERIKELAATPVKVKREIGYGDLENLVVHVIFFGLISKEERRKVVEPFYNFTKQQYDISVDKLEKYRSQIDKFALLLLESGIPSLKINVDMCQKLMELE